METLLNEPYLRFILMVVFLIYVFAEILKSVLKTMGICHKFGIIFSVAISFLFFIGNGKGIIAEVGIMSYDQAAIPMLVRAVDIIWTSTICGVGSMAIDHIIGFIKNIMKIKTALDTHRSTDLDGR